MFQLLFWEQLGILILSMILPFTTFFVQVLIQVCLEPTH